MATLIKTDGTKTQVVPADGRGTFTLQEMQGFVGGLIEIVGCPPTGILIINEEGKIHGLPLNVEATEIARAAGIASDDYIVGDALLASLQEIEEIEEVD